MDVILHIGAHRTASASFQHYLRSGEKRFEQVGLGYWGPTHEQKLHPEAQTLDDPELTPGTRFAFARSRVVDNLDQAQARGIAHLVVSDQNVIGTPDKLLQEGRLYSGIGEKMARYSEAFGGRLTRIVLSIRSQNSFWSSLMADAIARGHTPPTNEELSDIAHQARGWRDVITDLACAVTDIDIQVHPFEVFGSLPEYALAAMTDQPDLPVKNAREWLNKSPSRSELRDILTKRGEDPDFVPEGEGRWQPFDRDQSRALREAYADDLFWLRAGADGLAKLREVTGPAKAGGHPPTGVTKRGQDDGKDDRRLA